MLESIMQKIEHEEELCKRFTDTLIQYVQDCEGVVCKVDSYFHRDGRPVVRPLIAYQLFIIGDLLHDILTILNNAIDDSDYEVIGEKLMLPQTNWKDPGSTLFHYFALYSKCLDINNE